MLMIMCLKLVYIACLKISKDDNELEAGHCIFFPFCNMFVLAEYISLEYI